jgi:cytochrome c biogenesis protein CcmG/thiol:disulfide interchange protein DsbE
MRNTSLRLNWFVSGILVLALASNAVEGQTTSTSLIPRTDRRVAPDFALTDARGVRVRLAQYAGKVVLLDFWATWCTGCKLEIPWYIQFQKRYARQGLRSIGVAMDDEGWQKVNPYLTEHPISYPVVMADPNVLKPYEIYNLPMTLLIDRHGRIADAHVGVVDKDTWEQEIRELLHESR